MHINQCEFFKYILKKIYIHTKKEELKNVSGIVQRAGPNAWAGRIRDIVWGPLIYANQTTTLLQ